jgi:hypothetical protein
VRFIYDEKRQVMDHCPNSSNKDENELDCYRTILKGSEISQATFLVFLTILTLCSIWQITWSQYVTRSDDLTVSFYQLAG